MKILININCDDKEICQDCDHHLIYDPPQCALFVGDLQYNEEGEVLRLQTCKDATYVEPQINKHHELLKHLLDITTYGKAGLHIGIDPGKGDDHTACMSIRNIPYRDMIVIDDLEIVCDTVMSNTIETLAEESNIVKRINKVMESDAVKVILRNAAKVPKFPIPMYGGFDALELRNEMVLDEEMLNGVFEPDTRKGRRSGQKADPWKHKK